MTLVILKLLRKHYPQLPGVLVVVILATVISVLIKFEKIEKISPEQVVNTQVREQFEKLVANQAALKKIKHDQQAINSQLESDVSANTQYRLRGKLLRLAGEEKALKYTINKQKVDVFKIALVPQTADGGKVVYKVTEDAGLFSTVWRWAGADGDQFKLSGGGRVVGNIPSGIPSFSVPYLDFGLISGLFATALIMAMIGFMEATSISRALAAKTREKLNPNQELIGQGLANIVGSFFQSYTVSGSFSRSAVAARVGARTGFYAIISAVGVTLVMLFMTEYLYHLPMAVLAAIVMSAVFSLIDVKSLLCALKVRMADGIVGVVTFIATLSMAPKLADGVIIGVILTVIVFLVNTMKPRSEVMGMKPSGSLAGAVTHDLPPVSKYFVVLRFDASLIFINAAHFEQALLKALSEFPEARGILVLGHGINWIDATGIEKVRAMGSELSAAGVTLALAGLKQPVREALEKAGLDEIIGPENIFASKNSALQELEARFEKEAAAEAANEARQQEA
jgi:SulP family sulfate permease